MIFAIIYLIYLVLALLLTVTLFRRLKPRGWPFAVAGSLLGLCAFSLFLPVPIHGGFTFPLEIAWSELQREKWRHDEREKEEKAQQFVQGLQQRFAGVIDDYTALEGEGAWQHVEVSTGSPAWLDLESRLIWLAPRQLGNTVTDLDLEQAMAFCQRQSPQGYWALPTEGELALLWQHGGHHIMPGTGHSSAAMLVQGEFQLKLLTQYRGRLPGYTLRCVALSTTAPRRGYTASDIPLSLWNHYQLNKAETYSAVGSVDVRPFSQEIK